MAVDITEAFVQAFANNFMHVAQQSASRLEKAVTLEPNVVGASKSVNRLGQRTATRRTTRHGDTPINDQAHSTRYVDLFDWEDGDLLDDQDKIRMLVDPQSDYVKAMVAALNRAKDDVIISAALGSARSTSGNVALTAGQQIANGGTGMTKAKIITAKKIFRANEADEHNGEELYITYTDDELEDVLSDTTLTSADFMAVKALQEGDISRKWCGFNWIPTQRVPDTGSVRSCFAWAKSGIVLGVGKDITTKVGEDPSKAFNVRLYAKMSLGAVRVEEEKVVQIDCT